VANLWAKLQILTVLGALFPHFCPDIPAIWQEGVDLQSPIHAQFRVYRSNVSPLHGEKPYGLLSKCTTGMAALQAGLTLMIHDIVVFNVPFDTF